MKTLIAIILGFFSGLLIYLESAMVFTNPAKNNSPGTLFMLITFFGGWILTSCLIRRKAKSVSKVFNRGFLIGAAEWLLMIIVGIISGGKSAIAEASTTSSNTIALQPESVLAAGAIAFLTGGVSMVMAIICLIGFVISHSLGKEMKPE